MSTDEIQAARVQVAKAHRLSLAKVEMLETVERSSAGGCNWAGMNYTVLRALGALGLLTYKTECAPQYAGYRITAAGREVIAPVLEARAARRAKLDEQADAERAASASREARRALKIDGSGYYLPDAADDEIRRELGIDQILAAAKGAK